MSFVVAKKRNYQPSDYFQMADHPLNHPISMIL